MMVRSDASRDFRARKINSTPGPKEFFHVVNYAVAERLPDVPVALPDLAEVLTELARADRIGQRLATAAAGDSD
eukprot:2263560-Pyramimonas_sp.AAC.1